VGNYTVDEDVRSFWGIYGNGFVQHLHSDSSRLLAVNTRGEALCITHYSGQPNLNILFSSTRVHIKIAVTKTMRLKRSFYSGESGREGLVRLIVSHQQPLWQLLDTIANSAKIFTSTTAFQVRAHQLPGDQPIVLQLQIDRGESNATQSDLDRANMELKQG
jgi:hypothetical protein